MVAGSAVLVAGIAVVVVGSREDPCPTTITFEGRAYVERRTTEGIAAGDMLGSATEAGCAEKGSFTLEFMAHEVDGVAPEVAIVSATDAGAIFLVEGATADDLPPDVGAVLIQ